MTLSSTDISTLQLFKRQYLQLLDPMVLAWPPTDMLRHLDAQTWLLEHLFDANTVQYLPPERYQRRVLKKLFELIESSVLDPDEDEISDDLSSALTSLMSKNLPSEASAVQKQSYVTYTFSGSSLREEVSIALLEFRSIISTSGTTGLRTWETALHFGSYLISQGQSLVQGKRVLELGAGTGLLSILCAKWLGAEHVTATDGDDGVVEALQSNAFLNGLQEGDCFDARSLKWGRALDEGEGGEQKVVDVVLGADITYDSTSFPSLLSTLREFFSLNCDVDIIIGAAIRNDETFSRFLIACERSKFDVSDVEFAVPATHEQRGPFYPTQIPIRLTRITSPGSIEDPFAF